MGRDARRYDLIVAGLGPVGAVAANLAGAAGLRTLVGEKGDQPYEKTPASGFDAGNIRGFASIGLAREIAANLAGAAGLRTLVVEKGDQPYDKPRAIVFDAEIMRVFASIGLADEIAAVTKPLGGSVYLGADHAPIRTFRAHPRAHDKAWF